MDQMDQMDDSRSTLPPELACSKQGLDSRLAAIQATLDFYVANGFDVDAVSADPASGDVPEAGSALRRGTRGRGHPVRV
jgi:hypothetical protein